MSSCDIESTSDSESIKASAKLELIPKKSTSFWATIKHFASVLTLLLIIVIPLAIILKSEDNSNNDDDSISPSPSPELNPIFPKNWTVTGIRQDINNNIAITGSQASNPIGNYSQGFIYYGTLEDITSSKSDPSLHFFVPHFPGETPTFSAVYGPNTYLYDSTIGEGNILAVGGYNYAESPYQHGFIYQGPLDGSGVYTKIVIPPKPMNITFPNGTTIVTMDNPTHTVAHSVMGNLIVGNCYFASSVTRSHGFIYSLTTGFIRTVEVDLFSTSIYGIWQNNGQTSHSYTMVGGLSYIETNISLAYIMNYNALTDSFSDYTTYTYKNEPQAGTHFEGISKVDGGFTMAAIDLTASRYQTSALCYVPAFTNGTFGAGQWVELKQPDTFVSANTVLDYFIFGIYSTGLPSSTDKFIQENSFYANCSAYL